jgi:hypothetical protein
VRVSEALSIFAKIFVRIDGALQDFASDVHRYVPEPALRGVEASTFGALLAPGMGMGQASHLFGCAAWSILRDDP